MLVCSYFFMDSFFRSLLIESVYYLFRFICLGRVYVLTSFVHSLFIRFVTSSIMFACRYLFISLVVY